MNAQDSIWEKYYKFGGLSAILFISMVILDMVVGIVSGGDVIGVQPSVANRFGQFGQNMWLGLYQLDFLNVVNQLISIPIYFSLFGILRQTNMPGSLLSLILYLIGTAVFLANNVALPMLDLSWKFISAPESQRPILLAAGEALLARGAHGSPGAFISFLLPTLAALMFSFVMLKGNHFSKPTAYLGIVGNFLMFLYIYFVTFVPLLKDFAILLAMPGGLLILAWLILIANRMFKFGNGNNIKNNYLSKEC